MSVSNLLDPNSYDIENFQLIGNTLQTVVIISNNIFSYTTTTKSSVYNLDFLGSTFTISPDTNFTVNFFSPSITPNSILFIQVYGFPLSSDVTTLINGKATFSLRNVTDANITINSNISVRILII